MSIFERASRLKLRFVVTDMGKISVEDLWDLPGEQLDNIYADLGAQVQQQSVKRLLNTKRVDDSLILKMAIIEHVFNVKGAEREASTLKARLRVKFQRILNIKATRQDEPYQEMSIEELDAEIADMQEELAD